MLELGNILISATVGFLFGVLSVVISQWYQRRLDRKMLCDALLVEALDILDRLQFYEDLLDETEEGQPVPELGVNRDDMQVFMSNTGKLGLLLFAATPHMIQFYARVRRVVALVPLRELHGIGQTRDRSQLGKRRKEVADAITAGHAVVNTLERQVSKLSGVSSDIWLFRKRADERLKKRYPRRDQPS